MELLLLMNDSPASPCSPRGPVGETESGWMPPAEIPPPPPVTAAAQVPGARQARALTANRRKWTGFPRA